MNINPKQLVLNTLSVLLIIFKDKLLKMCPESPQFYPHIWNYYRACQRYTKEIQRMIAFLDLSQTQMHDDIHLLAGHFSEQLTALKEHVYLSAGNADPDLTSYHMIFFKLDLERRIKRLPTTLCDNNVCEQCLALL